MQTGPSLGNNRNSLLPLMLHLLYHFSLRGTLRLAGLALLVLRRTTLRSGLHVVIREGTYARQQEAGSVDE